MTPLIDMDILLYEIGFSCQKKEEDMIIASSWDHCQEMLDNKIAFISDAVEATQPPILFLTNNLFINKVKNRIRRWQDEEELEYIPLFRETLAVSKEYKGNRPTLKPFHYKNMIAYVIANYPTIINENGLEADDMMCITQKRMGDSSIICSRDKDLRQVEGWHYSWECGNQASIGPLFVEQPGHIELRIPLKKISSKTGKEISGGSSKIFGYGNKFFYAQLLTGDNVDNIGGNKGWGPVSTYNLLSSAETEWEMFQRVKEQYIKGYKEHWKTRMKEQANLLWMIRELDDENKAILWKPPSRTEEAQRTRETAQEAPS